MITQTACHTEGIDGTVVTRFVDGRTPSMRVRVLTHERPSIDIDPLLAGKSFLHFSGGVAQLGERRVRNAEAEGSNPFISTKGS